MQKIWNAILIRLRRADAREGFDTIETMSLREQADLPAHHPCVEARQPRLC